MSSDQNFGYLLYIGDQKLPSYIRIMISPFRDPYEPISTMERHKGFEVCSHEYYLHLRETNTSSRLS